jgi:hypothetical protein
MLPMHLYFAANSYSILRWKILAEAKAERRARTGLVMVRESLRMWLELNGECEHCGTRHDIRFTQHISDSHVSK